MINLFLYRLWVKPTYTIGNLAIGEIFFCNTLEDPVRDLNKDSDLNDEGEGKIWGDTAIPYGRYEVVVTFSSRFKRELPLVLDVHHFTGIRIHRGATKFNTNGCILVGDNTSIGRLTNGKYCEEKLTSILKNYILNGEKIFINIV